MPGRRAFLAKTTPAVGLAAGAAGCVGGIFESGTDAYLQFEAVSWCRDNQTYRAEVLDIAHHVVGRHHQFDVLDADPDLYAVEEVAPSERAHEPGGRLKHRPVED